jgi:hypothetical protein
MAPARTPYDELIEEGDRALDAYRRAALTDRNIERLRNALHAAMERGDEADMRSALDSLTKAGKPATDPPSGQSPGSNRALETHGNASDGGPTSAPGAISEQPSIASTHCATVRAPLDHALAYAALGWPILPVDPKTKRPLGGNGIEHATTDVTVIRRWWKRWPNAGIGVHLAAAGLCAIDIDPRAGTKKTPADFPPTLTARTGGGGWHLIYRAPQGTTLPGKLEAGIDIKHKGYVIVEPSIHPSGQQYGWLSNFDPVNAALVGGPDITPFPAKLLPDEKAKRDAAPELDSAIALAAATDQTIADLRSAFASIPSDDRDTWVRFGHAVKHLGDHGLELWIEWSKRSSKFDAEDAARVWESLSGERTDYRAVFAEAQRHGWINPRRAAPSAAQAQVNPRTAAQLLATTFQPIEWTVTRILPEGVYLLVAAPKIGKSWLALQIGVAVAGGHRVLGQAAKQGDTLILALEDSPRRLQSRLNKLEAAFVLDKDGLERFCYETKWPRVDEDGGAKLDAWLTTHPRARLVVIDVFERFRAPRSPKANLYSEDYAAMQVVKALADKHRVTVLIVHHTRKGEADDPLEMISGTQGLAGGADGVLVLKRPRGAERGELHVIGRDLEDEGAFVVEFHRATCRWEMVGAARDVAPTAERQAILDTLREAGSPLRPGEIAASIHKTPSATSNLLRKLVSDGLVQHAANRYSLPKSDESDETSESLAVEHT